MLATLIADASMSGDSMVLAVVLAFAMLAALLLDVTAFPQTFTAGNWPLSALNTGTWQITATFTLASSNAAWGSGNFFAIVAANDLGGLWIYDDGGTRKVALFENASGSPLIVEAALSWGAGANVTFTINHTANTITIAGATTGNGTFAFTGNNSGLPFSNVTLGVGVYGGGGFTWSGSLSDITDGVTGYSLTAESGTVGIAGTVANLLFGRRADAEAGTVGIVGTVANLLFGRRLDAEAGAVPVTGTDADLVYDNADEFITAEAGAIPITGVDAGLRHARRLDAESGAVPVVGTDAAITRGHPMTAEAGAVAVTGVDATLTVARRLAADAGAVAITGTDANLAFGSAISVGDEGMYQVNFGHAPASGSATLQTNVSGSSFLMLIGGNMNDIGDGPTDSESNTWRQIGASWNYIDPENSPWGVAAWRAINGVGDATSHVFTQGITLFDEMTFFAIELVGAHRLVAEDRQDEANAGTPGTTGPTASVTIPTAAGNVILIASWWGSGPVGQDHTASPDGTGWTLGRFFGTNNNDGYIQAGWWWKVVPAGATYTVQFTHSPAQGSKAWLMAFGAPANVTAEPGAVAITGTDAIVARGQHMAADGGAVPITGTDAAMRRGFVLTAEVGAVAIAGTDAGLLLAHVMAADGGTIAITGTDAALAHNYPLTAEPGALAITGTDAGLLYGRRMAADAGAVAIVGTDADLRRAILAAADPGALAITGTPANLVVAYRLAADAGNIPLSGVDANLVYTGATHVMAAEPGSVPIAGTDAGFLYSRVMVAMAGGIPILGVDADLRVTSPVVFVGLGARSTLVRKGVAGGSLVTVRTSHESTLEIRR